MGSIGWTELLILCSFYFLPLVVALLRHHRNRIPIAIVNVFLGWTLIGWVIALAWAFTAQRPPREISG